jgi:hypothetical protein
VYTKPEPHHYDDILIIRRYFDLQSLAQNGYADWRGKRPVYPPICKVVDTGAGKAQVSDRPKKPLAQW